MAELEEERPTTEKSEKVIRQQANLECQPDIVKEYDTLVDVKMQYGLPYALLKIPYPNPQFDIDDYTNLMITPSSSTSGTHKGSHPDVLTQVDSHNQYIAEHTISIS